jgi:hypothetical protein
VIGDGDEGVVFLRFALVHEEIIIAAARVFTRVCAARRRADFVNRAAPLLRVEELANAAEVLVALATHQIFVAVAFARVALLGCASGHTEMLGEPVDVAFSQHNDGIGAAIAGAFQTIIMGHCGDAGPVRLRLG